MSDKKLYDLRRTFLGNGFIRDRSLTSGHRYRGSFTIARRSITAHFTLDDLEFSKLPRLTLPNCSRECPEVVAHLHRNEFCYARSEQVLLDRYDVGGSALTCIQLARNALERVLTRKNFAAEIAQEFPQHWCGEDAALIDYRSSTSGRAWDYTIPRPGQRRLRLISDSKDPLRPFRLEGTDFNRASKSKQPAFVYRTHQQLTFKDGSRQPTTLSDFLEWIDSVQSGASKEILVAAIATYPDLPTILVSGPNGTVGVDISISGAIRTKLQRRKGLATFLSSQASAIRIQRIEGTRMDPDFLLSRNLNKPPPLGGKRIALVGCGTIGSHLGKFLVQSGTGWNGGSLTLIDEQTLTPGNLGRHLLAREHLGLNKATALRLELLRSFPDSAIFDRPKNVLGLLPQLTDFDLVIDATGEEAVSRSINDFFVRRRSKGRAPTVLHVWLFGGGDAAQGLLVESAEFGCYKCLRVGHAGAWRFSPLLPDQVRELVPGTCGEGMFMAYGVGAPAIAASLGLQMAMDWAEGSAKPYFRTICIDAKTTRSIKNQNLSRLSGCLACQPATSLDSAASVDQPTVV